MAAQALSTEAFLFDANGVKITSTRAILGGKTYAMSNISSVSIGMIPANRGKGYLALLIGAFVLLAGIADASAGGVVAGLLFLAVGYVLGILPKDTYLVKLGSASGEMDALSSTDRDFIDGIVNAMNEAIIQRG